MLNPCSMSARSPGTAWERKCRRLPPPLMPWSTPAWIGRSSKRMSVPRMVPWSPATRSTSAALTTPPWASSLTGIRSSRTRTLSSSPMICWVLVWPMRLPEPCRVAARCGCWPVCPTATSLPGTKSRPIWW